MKAEYRKVSNALKGTRKSLEQVCLELDVDPSKVEPHNILLDQCSHCSTWSDSLVDDLDSNPICKYCRDYIGL